jgi:hypothetical protein
MSFGLARPELDHPEAASPREQNGCSRMIRPIKEFAPL